MPKTKETLIKEKLLTALDYHFNSKLSAAQKQATMVNVIPYIKAGKFEFIINTINTIESFKIEF